jgi:hypothetical protein
MLLGMAAVALWAPGCGTVGEVMLGALKDAAVEAIQTATSQVVEQAANEIEAKLQQAVLQGVTGAITSE